MENESSTMKRISLVWILLVSLSWSLTGCGSSSSNTDPENIDKEAAELEEQGVQSDELDQQKQALKAGQGG